MMASIYHAQTPYHVLVSCAVALSKVEEESHLICSPGFGNPGHLIDTIRGWDTSPFESVVALPNHYQTSKYTRRLICKYRCMQLRRFASDILPEVVYVFNTSSPHSQALLYYAKEYNPAVTRFYVEDGIEAYRSDHSKTESTTTYYLERLLYGHWYQQVYVFGLSERVDRILVSYPEKVRNELKNKPIEEIDFEPIFHNHEFVYDYLDRLNARASLEAAAIVLLPLSNQFDDDRYSGALSDAVQTMMADDITVGVKYHPRETNQEYFDEITDGSVKIPNSLPIELLYLANRDKIQYVFGEFSTALMTARMLLDDAVVKSTLISNKEQDEDKTDIMRKFGISTVGEVLLSTE